MKPTSDSSIEFSTGIRMPRQLTLWDLTVDICGKIKQEKRDGVQIFYHFNGVALPMFKPGRII
jgi:hypothetical protein